MTIFAHAPFFHTIQGRKLYFLFIDLKIKTVACSMTQLLLIILIENQRLIHARAQLQHMLYF